MGPRADERNRISPANEKPGDGPEGGGIRRFTSRLAALWSRVRRGYEVRRAVARLEALDDRMLKDIGLSRCDIETRVGGESHWQ
jgi:uncharacterized protein YjiS (DUF1127 family)